MQHPLLQARPTDPFLRLRVGPDNIGDLRIDGDHVALVRPGRRSGEVWVSALGDDPQRIEALIDALDPDRIDGVHVHDTVYPHLREDLRGPDPGHWSIWELNLADCALADASRGVSVSASAHSAGEVVRLEPDDPRIDQLLAHSESAYIHAGDPSVTCWLGLSEAGHLNAVGAITEARGQTAHLVSICVDPAARGRGLGRQITRSLTAEALESGASGVWLEMYAGNLAAARTYRAVGFEERGRYRSALRLGRPSPPTGA